MLNTAGARLHTDYVLYHTQGCHLCELAAALLDNAGIHYILVDICDDNALAQQYGTVIPVLTAPDARELCWPFDAIQLQSFIGV